MPEERSPAAAVERALAAIATNEATVHAFVHLDEEWARSDATRVSDGPLRGLTLGIKDIFDTAELPTGYGSPIYAGHRPRSDAAAVALVRSAGAAVIGKTVTAELAWFTPGPTTNPHRPTHTPGGSSSGSAAAVATGMADLALGTQTAGSVIRPASFCGVLGYKPTFGLVPTAGVKPGAPSLDTVGLFAADLEVLDAARVVLTGLRDEALARPARFALVRTDVWSDADPDCRAVIEEAAKRVGADERELPGDLVGVAGTLALIQAYEGARGLAWERATASQQLSDGLREILDWGAGIATEEYVATRRRASRARRSDVTEELFGEADVLITPGAVGEAPEGLSSTGDPRFCRLWTLLGYPALSVPGLTGATGLPIGVQLVARPYTDAMLIDAARCLADALGRAG